MTGPQPLTTLPGHWFFGYYGVSPWDSAGRRHLALRTEFADRLPAPGEQAQVVCIDTHAQRAQVVSQTAAFNFQQGAMLHWLDVGFGQEILFNDWREGKVVSTALDPDTGRRRTLEVGVTDVCPARGIALGLDFARMWHCRRIVGYANHASRPLEPIPRDDGLHLLDLVTGRARLLVSLWDLLSGPASPWSLEQVQCAWIDHAYLSPGGRSVATFVRVKQQGVRQTALMRVDADTGSARLMLSPSDRPAHMAWRDERSLIISCRQGGQAGFHVLHDDAGQAAALLAENLPEDGHPSFSPDGQWLVTDTLPTGDDSVRELFLLHVASGRLSSLGRYASAVPFRGDVRCDLHPRWRPDGQAISFDGSHEGRRLIYTLDVSALMR